MPLPQKSATVCDHSYRDWERVFPCTYSRPSLKFSPTQPLPNFIVISLNSFLGLVSLFSCPAFSDAAARFAAMSSSTLSTVSFIPVSFPIQCSSCFSLFRGIRRIAFPVIVKEIIIGAVLLLIFILIFFRIFLVLIFVLDEILFLPADYLKIISSADKGNGKDTYDDIRSNRAGFLSGFLSGSVYPCFLLRYSLTPYLRLALLIGIVVWQCALRCRDCRSRAAEFFGKVSLLSEVVFRRSFSVISVRK